MDRHYFSEPRPVEDADIPTWHVDVFRQNVSDAIFTLVIDETTLPPRKRKKRVVWKLPSTIEEKPNFGSDEKKRMLELFKQQKKTRKKQLKRSSSSVYSNNGEATTSSNNIPQEEENQQQQPEEQETNGRHSPEFYLVQEESEEANRNVENGHDSNTHEEAPETKDTNGESPIPAPPPPIPPPGFAQMSLQEPPQQQDETPSSNDVNNHARYFVVSSLSTNIPVDVAKLVVDIYYPTLYQSSASQLVHYYCPNANKSLSVGGAHAVCCSETDVLLQLKSLEGFHFLVKGVVAQPGISSSVVLLITGMVQSAHVHVQQAMAFCHSLTLISSSEGTTEFQIHNDAMALLTE